MVIGTEARKESVLPVLREGTEESAFPHLLHGRVYADFRQTEAYFDAALDLMLSLYEIQPRHPVAELRTPFTQPGDPLYAVYATRA